MGGLALRRIEIHIDSSVGSGIEGADFVDPALVAAAFEAAVHEGQHGLFCYFWSGEAFADAHHVGIVVKPGELRAGHIVHGGGAHSSDFVGGDSNADAAAANAQAQVGGSSDHGTANSGTVIGVVNSIVSVSSQIDDFVAQGAKHFHQQIFEMHSRVVCPSSDSDHAQTVVRWLGGLQRTQLQARFTALALGGGEFDRGHDVGDHVVAVFKSDGNANGPWGDARVGQFIGVEPGMGGADGVGDQGFWASE